MTDIQEKLAEMNMYLLDRQLGNKRMRAHVKTLMKVRDKDEIRNVRNEDPILAAFFDMDEKIGRIGLLSYEESNNLRLSVEDIFSLELRIAYPALIREEKGRYVFEPISTPYMNNRPKERDTLAVRSREEIYAGRRKVDGVLRKEFNLSYGEYQRQIVEGIEKVKSMKLLPSNKELKKIFPNYPFDYYK